MKSSRRNRLAAITVFTLIAAGVIGGMTWGTVNSLKLAEEHVTGEISRAAWEMSNYMAGIINAETARNWTDYPAVHQAKEFAAYLHGGVELDADYVVLPSPLAVSPPRHDWIDLYFQVDPRGVLSSPQLAAESEPWPFEYPHIFPAIQDRARHTIEWLKAVLPEFHLKDRFEMVCTHESPLALAPSGAGQAGGTSKEQRGRSGVTGRQQASRDYQRRKQVLQESQVRYLPPLDCVDASIAEQNLLNVAGSTNGFVDEALLELSGEVSVKPDPIATFWLGQGPDGEWKLAFLRKCHADALVFYQGFIGDWGRLKPKLLAQIGDRFPDADLLPVLTDEEPDPSESRPRMINLPVRLQVGSIPGGVSVAAWHRVRGTLLASWAAALGVLVLAGWGLRNLVALTERRMQFAYAVTHELRTPLTTFRLYSDMLSAGLVPDASKQEYLDTLNNESLRLSSLVEEVLEYARLENHKVKLNPTDTDGESLLHVISEALEKRCVENGIEARTEIAIANGQRLRTDVDLVNRIASVLVNNACRHVRGTDGAVVLVHLGGGGRHIHLDVIDSGPGIERSDVRMIFRPFRRGRKADAAAQGGIGLGLALARSWASLLGGRLELTAGHHPKYGGAHFRLTIPTKTQV